MIVTRSRWLRTGEVWFDEDPSGERVDVIVFRQRSQPVDGARCTVFHSLEVDLTPDPDAILARMTKDTRYEIRRAADKDKVVAKCWFSNSGEALDRFCEFYDRFAAGKGLGPARRPYLKSMAEAGVLDLSLATSPDGAELVWHAYYRSNGRVRLQHSASLFREGADNAFRNLVGRANRFLHWDDMLRFKREGVTTYDWGGWYEGTEDQDRLRINQFKEEFGGQVVKTYNCVQVVSAKGRLVLATGRLLGKVR